MTKRCKNCGWPNDDSATICQKCNAPLDTATQTSPSRSTVYEAPGGGYAPTASEGSENNLRRTVSENQFFGTDNPRGNSSYQNNYMGPTPDNTVTNGAATECPNCHYQVRAGINTCPNCGYPISAGGGRQQPPQHKTKPCPKCGAQNPEEAKFCNNCGTSMNPVQQGNGNQPQNHAHSGTVNPWTKHEDGDFFTLKPIAWEGENINHGMLSYSGKVISLNRANTDPNNQSITSQEQAELTCEDGEWYIIDKSAMHTTYVLASRKMKLKKGDTIILGNRLFEFN